MRVLIERIEEVELGVSVNSLPVYHRFSDDLSKVNFFLDKSEKSGLSTSDVSFNGKDPRRSMGFASRAEVS